MSQLMKPSGGPFSLTPHKVGLCILLQWYSTLFRSPYHHNLLGLFLLSQTKSHSHFLEPPLDRTLHALLAACTLEPRFLLHRLHSLQVPDDLFNFFSGLKGVMEADDCLLCLDPGSVLGVFVRRCVLGFSSMFFEGVCHLLRDIQGYCRASVLMGKFRLEGAEEEEEGVDAYCRESGKGRMGKFEGHGEYEEMDFERAGDVAGSPGGLLFKEGRGLFGTDWEMDEMDDRGGVESGLGDLKEGGVFLRTHWQIQGYLAEKADEIEKNGSSFLFNEFESVLKQLQKLAPELHRVHFLRYLNNLYHDDYPAALENLHRYFDYSAGMEGFECIPPSSGNGSSFGRYEIALLCLGMMQLQFGHPKQSLEVLTEAVRVSR